MVAAMLLISGCVQSIQKDIEMGRQYAPQIERDMGLYRDATRAQYLDRVAERLVNVNPDQTFEYQFAIVDQYVPNAFALPGGYIYLTRGLIALTNNEDELAGVIGHEIIHVSRRHSARQMAKAQVPALFALPGAIVGGVFSETLGDLLMAPAALIGGAYLASYSRQDEFEADRYGQQLAAAAGYEPESIADILNRLEAFAEASVERKRIPSFFDTHPTAPDRVDRLRRDAAALDWQRQPGVAPNAQAYLKGLEGLLVGDDPAMGVIKGYDFLHPIMNFYVALPDSWDILNTRQAVFAAAPQKDGLLVLSIAGKGTDPKEAVDRLEEAMYLKYRVKPTESETLKINGLPARLLTYTDYSAKEPVNMSFLWIAYQGLIYQFTGMAPERYWPLIKGSTRSFRPLTTQEKASIEEMRLRVVPALAGETFEQLSKRTQNAWDIKITAIINGLDADRKLEQGQLIKIAVLQPYTGNRL
jgi:predicted Zn-dependent protease